MKNFKRIFIILNFCLIVTSGILLIFFAFFQTDSTENYAISVMRNEFIIPEILDNKTVIKEKKTTEWRIQHQYVTLLVSPTEINALLAHNSPMKSCSSSGCKMLNWYKIRPTSGNYFSEGSVDTENIMCAKKSSVNEKGRNIILLKTVCIHKAKNQLHLEILGPDDGDLMP